MIKAQALWLGAALCHLTGTVFGQSVDTDVALVCDTIREVRVGIAAELKNKGWVNTGPHSERIEGLNGVVLTGFDENSCDPDVDLESSKNGSMTVYYLPAFRTEFPDTGESVLTIQFSVQEGTGAIDYAVLHGKNP